MKNKKALIAILAALVVIAAVLLQRKESNS